MMRANRLCFPFCALIFLQGGAVRAQDSGKPFTSSLVKHWQNLKTLSLAVAEAIPESAYTSKAPFAEANPNENGPYQLGSLALTNVLACSLAFGTRAPERFETPFEHPVDWSKSSVIKNLTAAYDYCVDGLNQMNDSDLLTMNLKGFKGHRAIKFDILWDAYGHAAHNLGQAEMYLRSKGITPPDTGPRFDF